MNISKIKVKICHYFFLVLNSTFYFICRIILYIYNFPELALKKYIAIAIYRKKFNDSNYPDKCCQSHTYTCPKTIVNICYRIMTRSSIYEIRDDESKRVCKRTYIQCNHEMTCRELSYSV